MEIELKPGTRILLTPLFQAEWAQAYEYTVVRVLSFGHNLDITREPEHPHFHYRRISKVWTPDGHIQGWYFPTDRIEYVYSLTVLS